LEKVLIQNITLSFTERSLYQLGITEGPSRKTVTAKDGLDSWKQFGNEAWERSSVLAKNLEHELSDMKDSSDEDKLRKLREHKYFVHLSERCELFVHNVDRDWKLEEIPRNGSRQALLNFKPVWITPDLANKFIWNRISCSEKRGLLA